MGSTMLQLVQMVTGEAGLVVPNSVAGNTSQDTQQILALMNAVGNELLPKFEWQALQTAYTFYAPLLQANGDVVNGSAVIINLTSTAGIVPGTWMVTGLGILQDVHVVSVDSATQVTISQPANVTALQTQLTFSQTQYTMPDGYDRPVNRTQWDKSKHWEMIGPETPQQWEWLKSGYIATGPRIRWRIMGGYFQIWPALNTRELLGFEYVSKNWVITAAGATAGRLVNDSDTAIFSDRSLVIGTKLKYFETKGFDTTALKRDFDAEVDLRMATEQGAPTLSQAPRLSQVLIDQSAIPDSGFGQAAS